MEEGTGHLSLFINTFSPNVISDLIRKSDILFGLSITSKVKMPERHILFLVYLHEAQQNSGNLERKIKAKIHFALISVLILP